MTVLLLKPKPIKQSGLVQCEKQKFFSNMVKFCWHDDKMMKIKRTIGRRWITFDAQLKLLYRLSRIFIHTDSSCTTLYVSNIFARKYLRQNFAFNWHFITYLNTKKQKGILCSLIQCQFLGVGGNMQLTGEGGGGGDRKGDLNTIWLAAL